MFRLFRKQNNTTSGNPNNPTTSFKNLIKQNIPEDIKEKLINVDKFVEYVYTIITLFNSGPANKTSKSHKETQIKYYTDNNNELQDYINNIYINMGKKDIISKNYFKQDGGSRRKRRKRRTRKNNYKK